MKNLLFILLAFLLVTCASSYNYNKHKEEDHKSSEGHFDNYNSDSHAHHNSDELKTKPEQHAQPVNAGLYGSIPLEKRKKLKAVLIVGPITSDNDATTLEYVNNLKYAGKLLKELGVQVHEFYTPDNDWAKIKAACENANFLIYKGHGVYDGSNPPVWVGGFCLKGSFPSSSQIQKEVKLAPNAVILISGCFTAGNAGFDIGQINITEARRRVEMYSKPFMDLKASCYYANWYPNAFHDFLDNLFKGKTFGEAYRGFGNGGNPAEVKVFKYPNPAQYSLFVGSENYSGKTAFNNALVGNPETSLKDLIH